MKNINNKQNSTVKLLSAAILGAIITVTSLTATPTGAQEISKFEMVAKATADQAIKVNVTKGIKVSDVKAVLNKDGSVSVTSKVLNNNKNAAVVAFTPKAKTSGKVLKLRTKAGLETVAYSISTKGLVKARVYKAGDLVLVTATTSKVKNAQEVTQLISRGILPVTNKKFNGAEVVTVAQFSEALGKALGLSKVEYTEEEGIEDTTDFYSEYNAALEQLGIMEGTPYVNDPISRYEAYTVLGNLMKLQGGKATANLDKLFKDAKDLEADQKVPFQLLAQVGAITGKKNLLSIDDELTADQLVKAMNKVLKNLGMM